LQAAAFNRNLAHNVSGDPEYSTEGAADPSILHINGINVDKSQWPHCLQKASWYDLNVRIKDGFEYVPTDLADDAI
jgi:hypothetical protein